MQTLSIDFENLVHGPGPGIAITGMTIVFAALGLISACIFFLPTIMEKIGRIYPEPQVHGPGPETRPARDDTEVVAAIAAALHAHAPAASQQVTDA